MMSELPNIGQVYRILSQEEKHLELSKLSHNHLETTSFGVERNRQYSKSEP